MMFSEGIVQFMQMRIPIVNEVRWGFGRVAERLMAAVLKTANGESRSWVQIPPLPPAVLLCGKSVCHAKFRLRCSKRSDTLMLAIRADGRVSASLRIPMDQQPPTRHIQNPILVNARSSVKHGFRSEVEGEARIGDLYYQAQVLGPRVSGWKV